MTIMEQDFLNVTLGANVAATAVDVGDAPLGIKGLTLQATITVAGGGGAAKAYVQTSLDGGTTWIDIACFAFTTSTAKKVVNLRAETAVTTAVTPVDGALTDNTVVSGILGTKFRTKYVTSGTVYTGASSFVIKGVFHA